MRWLVRRSLRVLRFLYFPDEFILYSDIVVRSIFTLYYLPIMALVVAATHSVLSMIVYSLIVPMVRGMELEVTAKEERGETTPYYFGSVTWALVAVSVKVAPFATLGAGAAMLGHKASNCVGEAMTDAFSFYDGRDYPLLVSRLLFLFETRARLHIFSATLVSVLLLVLVTFFTDTFVNWSSRSREVLFISWLIISSQLVFILGTAVFRVTFEGGYTRTLSRLKAAAAGSGRKFFDALVQSPALSPQSLTSPIEDFPLFDRGGATVNDAYVDDANQQPFINFFTDAWWKTSISRIRHFAMELSVLSFVVLLLTRGFLDAMRTTVEVLMYLNIPHLFGFCVLSIAVAVTRVLQSFKWLSRHRGYALAPIIHIVSVYQALLLYAAVYFFPSSVVLVLSGVMSVLLWARGIDLAREFDVGGTGGRVLWQEKMTKKPIAPGFAVMLEDAFERGKSAPAIVSLDLRADVQAMQLLPRKEAPRDIERIVAAEATKKTLSCAGFYFFAVPRLFTLQSSASFTGRRFRNVRVFLRTFQMTLLLVYMLLVGGMVLQAVFPTLRPLPVRVVETSTFAVNDSITIDHTVVQLTLVGRGEQGPIQVEGSEKGSPDFVDAFEQHETSFGAAWGNTEDCMLQGTSGAHGALCGAGSPAQRKLHPLPIRADEEDLYPGLCAKEYFGFLSAWELSLLSDAPYLFSPGDVDRLLGFMNKNMGTDWVAMPRLSSKCSAHQYRRDAGTNSKGAAPLIDWNGYLEFHSAKRGVSVIAVRGTDLTSFMDMLQDVSMFFEVALYHVMSSIVPGAAILPTSLIADFIRAAAMAEQITHASSWRELLRRSGVKHSSGLQEPNCFYSHYRRDYHVDVYNHILQRSEELAAEDDHKPNATRLILVGHSLGGSIGHVVASKLDVPSVAFSSPGIVLSRKKFDVPLRQIHKNTMTVVSSHDIVPTIGGQGGEIHHVECMATRRELCHAIEFMIGSIWHSCASVRNKFPGIRDVR